MNSSYEIYLSRFLRMGALTREGLAEALQKTHAEEWVLVYAWAKKLGWTIMERNHEEIVFAGPGGELFDVPNLPAMMPKMIRPMSRAQKINQNERKPRLTVRTDGNLALLN